jgi:hypothetical protein
VTRPRRAGAGIERASGARLWDLDENECYYEGTAIESARS